MSEARNLTLRFLTLIEQRLGFECADWQKQKLPFLLRVRVQRTAHVQTPAAYLNWLSTLGAEHAEFFAIANELTVGETYFFREPRAFDVLIRRVLPELLMSHPNQPVRILSAGCSSGEEPYTLALLIRSLLGNEAQERIEIVGIDASPSALQKANAAVYSEWSLRATPPDVRHQWFFPQGPSFRLSPIIQSMVCYHAKNLLAPSSTFLDIGQFHVVFCRNVTIYFAPTAIARTIELMARLLQPGGYLFLGHSETLRGAPGPFELVHQDDEHAFYYRRRPEWRSEPPDSTAPNEASDLNWVSHIEESVKRLHAATAPAVPQPPLPPPPLPRGRRSGSFQTALELLRDERFADAMSLLQSLRKNGPSDDPDIELLLAVACFNQGQFSAAEQLCARLLRMVEGEQAANALYVQALCHEHTGDPQTAIAQFGLASERDPSFAMPHLHLGLLQKRLGDVEQARRALGRAAELVASERAERIVLFGGGFQKKALLSLCKSELVALGGSG